MKRGGKIIVICPHCGAEQAEPDQVKSTYCRKCSGHFAVRARGTPTSAPAPKPGLTAAEPRPQPPTKSAAPGGLTAFFNSFRAGPKTKIIHCFECKQPQEVSTSAQSSNCACGAHIDLADVKVNAAFSRILRTRGDLILGSKGEYSSTRGYCGNALIQGTLKGSLTCDGEATLKLKGRIAGTLEARSIVIDKHADVEFSRLLKGGSIEIRGKLQARVEATGTVHIAKGGSLEGSIVARGFSVEKGGFFSGEVTIGKRDLEQAELSLDANPKGGPQNPPPDLFGTVQQAPA